MPTTPDAPLRAILKSQYHAALGMLHDAIDQCPDALWISRDYQNAFWHIAYHTLFYAHLYLGRDEAAFRAWPGNRPKIHFLPGSMHTPTDVAAAATPYTKAQLLDYWRHCDAMVDEAVDSIDLGRQECGFSWYATSKLEHQIINIRHVQHHAAQLIERLRVRSSIGSEWIGTSAQVTSRPM